MKMRQIGIITAVVSLLVGAAQAQVDAVFIASSSKSEYDANVYRAIWDEYGERIVAAFQTWTCMPFPESSVSAVVAEAVSNSGGPEHPMRLRASYIRRVKQSTLVHELGHRHLWQLVERLDDENGTNGYNGNGESAETVVSTGVARTTNGQSDSPACATCGSIMIRSGTCYRCQNCGSTSGCS